jgi:hypothetical protein
MVALRDRRPMSWLASVGGRLLGSSHIRPEQLSWTNAGGGHVAGSRAMANSDPLFIRAQHVVLENRLLRLELRRLRMERRLAGEVMRERICESALLRAEAGSLRSEVTCRRDASTSLLGASAWKPLRS